MSLPSATPATARPATPAGVRLRATTTVPDARASCPRQLGWMLGSPPARDKQIRWQDGSAYRFPQLRWSFCHTRELVPTVAVPRDGAISVLPRAERADIDALTVRPLGSREQLPWAGVLEAGYTDGIVVLHRGQLVHERYFGALGPHTHHTAMSITKSVYGLLALQLVADGALREDMAVTHLVPGLRGTGLAGATVGQLLDMSTALRYSEDYADPHAEVWAHVHAGRVLPRPAGWVGPDGFDAFLHTLQPMDPAQSRHGQHFAYRTVNADALGAVLRSAAGQGVPELLGQLLWQPLGMEADAFFQVDGQGVPFAGGGLNTTLRDLARLGELLRCEGAANGRQVLAPAVVASIRQGGHRELAAAARHAIPRGWSYRAMWWTTHNPSGVFMARGVHGQLLLVDPAAEMVVARYASHPMPSNAASDPVSLPAWARLGELLRGL